VAVQKIRRAGGIFRQMHNALMGVSIPFDQLDLTGIEPDLLALAQRTWETRVVTEFRSVQIMNRFLTEVLAAGDPLDVYAGIVDLIGDEIRHVALCSELVSALGGTAHFPEPILTEQSKEFLALAMPERALATAISMLAVNETLSACFITDLASRCNHPVIGAVLNAIIEDESEHDEFGWQYVKKSLERFPHSTRAGWSQVAQEALAPQRLAAEAVLKEMPGDRRNLKDWPEPELAHLGLFGPQRQALVYDQAYREHLAPRLEALELL
jgi:hypothetical protein